MLLKAGEMKIFRHISMVIYKNMELIFWLAALLILFFSPTEIQHYTLCPLKNLGFSHCPGCGLGRSITLAMHGRVAESLSMHPFGVIAMIVIVNRIFLLSRLTAKNYLPKTQKL